MGAWPWCGLRGFGTVDREWEQKTWWMNSWQNWKKKEKDTNEKETRKFITIQLAEEFSTPAKAIQILES